MSACEFREALRPRLVCLPGVMTASKAFAALATGASGVDIGAALCKPGGPAEQAADNTIKLIANYSRTIWT